jgi:hypothetical protein
MSSAIAVGDELGRRERRRGPLSGGRNFLGSCISQSHALRDLASEVATLMVEMVGAALGRSLMTGTGQPATTRTGQGLTPRAVALPAEVASAHEERLVAQSADEAVERDLVHPPMRQDENWTSAGWSARVTPYTRPSAEGTPRAQVAAWALAFTPYSPSVQQK